MDPFHRFPEDFLSWINVMAYSRVRKHYKLTGRNPDGITEDEVRSMAGMLREKYRERGAAVRKVIQIAQDMIHVVLYGDDMIYCDLIHYLGWRFSASPPRASVALRTLVRSYNGDETTIVVYRQWFNDLEAALHRVLTDRAVRVMRQALQGYSPDLSGKEDRVIRRIISMGVQGMRRRLPQTPPLNAEQRADFILRSVQQQPLSGKTGETRADHDRDLDRAVGNVLRTELGWGERYIDPLQSLVPSFTRTPSDLLHQAVREGDAEAVRYLLEELDADPNSRWMMGDTPLHMAARFGHAEIVRLLLRRGADPYLTDDNMRQTAFDSALRKKDGVVIQALVDGGFIPSVMPQTMPLIRQIIERTLKTRNEHRSIAEIDRARARKTQQKNSILGIDQSTYQRVKSFIAGFPDEQQAADFREWCRARNRNPQDMTPGERVRAMNQVRMRKKQHENKKK